MGDSFTGEDGYTQHQFSGSTGISTRDYMATKILAGMLANQKLVGFRWESDSDRAYVVDDGKSRLALCHRAYMIADDMSKAREIGKGPDA